MRLAAIDIGTNSLHMIVVRVRPDFSFEVIDREKEMVRLGAGGLDGRALVPQAMNAALQTLSKFRRLAESHQVQHIEAVATSAVREAENGGDFLKAIVERTGIRARVISGTEEARLIHLAAAYGLGLTGEAAVTVDIGGGSVEITYGTGERLEAGRSFKLGAIRLTERFVKSDPLSPRDERRLVHHIDAELRSYLDGLRERGFDRVVGTSGSILSIGTIAAAAEEGVVPTAVRNRRIRASQVHRVRKALCAAPLQKRLAIAGLEARRADIAVAASVLIDVILRRLGAADITLCDLSLREGLLLDYVAAHRAEIVHVEQYPDVRRRSVIELAERCSYAAGHARHIASLALALFDATRGLHALTDREREWLEYGALLHDIGVHISYERHHKHSSYLIRHGDLRGFDPQEVEIIALLARYHRRATPSRTHDSFGGLPKKLRRAVRTLGAILRLAETLDRSHAQIVAGLRLEDGIDEARLLLDARGDAELELWAASRHKAPFEAVIGKPLRIEAIHHSYAEQPDDAARVSGEAVGGRGHRRLGQDDAAGAAREMARGGGPPGVGHRMELVRAGESGHAHGQEEEHADADDVQPAARHRLRG
jgi:exopolyphosphatase/guanosine-5'-triphosphate,3'-diphosphate pyrophosphatase